MLYPPHSCWLSGRDLWHYSQHRQQYMKNAQRPGLNEAIWEIEEDPTLERSDHGGSILKELERVKVSLAPPSSGLL